MSNWTDERFVHWDWHEEYMEGIVDDLDRTPTRVAPMAPAVAGGAVRGLITGSPLGLPGMVGGAVAGGAGAALGAYGAARRGGTAARKARPGAQASSSAANELLRLLGVPEVQRALVTLGAGDPGRQSVPVGSAQTPVPAAAIAELLQLLLGRATQEAAARFDGAESELDYMADDSGALVGDPTLDGDRAARVLALLNQAQLDRIDDDARHGAQTLAAEEDFGGEDFEDDADESTWELPHEYT